MEGDLRRLYELDFFIIILIFPDKKRLVYRLCKVLTHSEKTSKINEIANA